MSTWKTDVAFGPVPLWVIESGVSSRAVHLYALLAARRDFMTDQLALGRKALGKTLRCSVDTVDRAKQELVEIGAISVEAEVSKDGSPGPNVYTIHRLPPDLQGGPQDSARIRNDAADPSRTGAAQKTQTQTSQTSSSSRTGRAPTQLAGKRVTAAEESFAVQVLTVFNDVSGRRFGSKEALGKIVLRHREHPDLTVEDHERIIRQQFERPWWKGDPSPSVIYGNGEVFDRALNGVQGAAPRRRVYTKV